MSPSPLAAPLVVAPSLVAPRATPAVTPLAQTQARKNKQAPSASLPPGCQPFVVVLTGVPALKTGENESFENLKNKTSFWLRQNRPLPGYIDGRIINVRRVGWVGNRHKNLKDDCVLVNFRDPRAAGLINRQVNHYDSNGIQTRDLGYFYRPLPTVWPNQPSLEGGRGVWYPRHATLGTDRMVGNHPQTFSPHGWGY